MVQPGSGNATKKVHNAGMGALAPKWSAKKTSNGALATSSPVSHPGFASKAAAPRFQAGVNTVGDQPEFRPAQYAYAGNALETTSPDQIAMNSVANAVADTRKGQFDKFSAGLGKQGKGNAFGRMRQFMDPSRPNYRGDMAAQNAAMRSAQASVGYDPAQVQTVSSAPVLERSPQGLANAAYQKMRQSFAAPPAPAMMQTQVIPDTQRNALIAGLLRGF